MKPTLNPANVDTKDLRPTHLATQQPDHIQDLEGTRLSQIKPPHITVSTSLHIELGRKKHAAL